MITIDDNILDFLTGIHKTRGSLPDRKNEMLILAFNKAFLDMANHTLKYATRMKTDFFPNTTAKSESNKTIVRQCIMYYFYGYAGWGALKKISCQAAFDKWHEYFCTYFHNNVGAGEVTLENLKTNEKVTEQIKEVFDPEITYGQIQKLLNMTLKYLYIFTKCEPINPNPYNDIKSFLHVPLDSYVLNEIYNKKNKNFKGEKYRRSAWSKINNYKDYSDCQLDIRNYVTNNAQYSCPFDWELTEWPFNNNTMGLDMPSSINISNYF